MRQPTTSPQILTKSIHGGHTIGDNGIGDTNSTITRFGSASGVFRVRLEDDAPSGVFAEFFPYQDIEITDIKIVRNSPASDTPSIRFQRSNRNGSSTATITTIALTASNGSIDRADSLSNRLVLGSQGQKITINMAAAPYEIDGGATAYIEFLNRST